jgi:transcriptional regulator with XRE-family HTH domain
MAKTKGAAALHTATTPAGGLSQAEVATKLGVSRQAVSAWAAGESVPRAEYAAQLEDLLGIRMRDWAEVES